MSSALERLDAERVIVADGGTGALLTAVVPRLRCPEEANLKAPEAVVKVHLGFIRAGAELIEANTFGANRRKLSAQLLDDRLEDILEQGVKIAREARDVSGSPVFVAGAIGPLGDLEGSHGAENAYDVFHEQARLLEGRGVDLFMVETFFDLDELVTAIQAVRDVSPVPIVAQLTFDEDAETLAGVSARDAVGEGREPRLPMLVVEREQEVRPFRAAERTLLQRKLEAGEWTVSVELDPPKGTNMDAMLTVAKRLKDSEAVDATDINDNPMARARLSALMAAVAIESTVGLETIPHVTPRDASVMGLQSQLLGAHAAGIRNILAVTGDPPHVGDYPGSSGVYEVDAIGLTGLISHLNEGEDYSGKAIDAPTSFYVGVAVNPSPDDLDAEVERFRRKVDAGARFGMTQALFDLAYLDRFLERLGGSCPIPLLVGIWPLSSFQLAFRLHNEVPGITIPEPIQQRLADAGAEAKRVGFELARSLLDGARERAAGVYIIPPFKEPAAALEVLGP